MTLSFSELQLVEPIQRALRTQNYHTPTPIQARAIPALLQGRDVLGLAQTGTGKTAAFALPILQTLFLAPAVANRRGVRALILTPTRELAIQIDDSFKAYGQNLQLRHKAIYGGVGQNPQVDALARGLDILIATPGRLLDLMNQGHVKLDQLSVFVLDEADRMLDMGFIRDVKRIVSALPHQRQTLLFSATMPPEIAQLAGSLLKDPIRIEATPVSTPVEKIDQRLFFVDGSHKRALLAELLKMPAISRALVFTRTKHGANRVCEHLQRLSIGCEAIHGNKSQNARQRALEDFRSGRARVLVATDIAARGIDIDGITHVINFDIPNIPESYVHRIGRTARAGASGTSFSFCAPDERAYLKDIEKLIRRTLPVVEEHPFAGLAPAPKAPQAPGNGRGGPRQGHGGHGRPAQGRGRGRR